MRARKVDANHGEIKRAFEKMGCSVIDLSAVGGGCPDLLIGRGENVLVEVKTKRGKYTVAQVEFNATWRGRRTTVRNLDDVDAVVKSMREKV